MRKFILVLCMVFCCVTCCVAQHIDEEKLKKDWGHLVQETCKEYVLKLLKDNGTKSNASYNEVKNIPCDSLNLEKIKTVLENNGATDDVKVRVEVVSVYFDSVSHLTPSIALLTPEKIDNPDFTNISHDLRNRYSNEYKKQEVVNQNVPVERTTFSTFVIILIIVILILILVVVCLAVIIYNLSKSLDATEYSKKKLEEELSTYKKDKTKPVEPYKTNSPTASVEEQRPTKFDKTLNVASETDSVKEERKNEEKEEIKEDVKDMLLNKSKESPKTFYPVFLKNFKDGTMKVCPSRDGAQYELLMAEENSSIGEFSFIGNVTNAVATKDATFSEVCDLENFNTSATLLITIEKGKAERTADGKWKVTKPAKVRFS